MHEVILNEIIGTWSLRSFDIEDLNMKVAPWGANAHGLLIYAESGHMSVSINRDLEDKSANNAENIYDSILFYSGTYQIDGNTINHLVSNASNPTRIGKKMLRFAELSNDVITLTSPVESFGRAILKWQRVK